MARKTKAGSCSFPGPEATVQLCLRRLKPPGPPVKDYTSACELVRGLAGADREHFVALHLDAKDRLIGVDRVATGQVQNVSVAPREPFKAAMLNNAVRIVLVHNHPSGSAEPSRQDLELTARMRQVGELVGIEVQDHIIVGDKECISLRSRGWK